MSLTLFMVFHPNLFMFFEFAYLYLQTHLAVLDKNLMKILILITSIILSSQSEFNAVGRIASA
jgi:hypothetical protein